MSDLNEPDEDVVYDAEGDGYALSFRPMQVERKLTKGFKITRWKSRMNVYS